MRQAILSIIVTVQSLYARVLLAFVGFALAAGCYAQTDASSEFKIGTYARLSGRLAFSATVNDRQQIYVFDLDAKQVRPLVLGPGNNSVPNWSPDGAFLAFASDRDGQKEIYVIGYDGKGLQRLTDNKVDDDNPSWSVDGKRVLYSSITGPDENSNLFSIAMGSDQPKRLTNFEGKNIAPRMSKDGQQILFATNRFWPGWDICSLPAQGGSERCLLKGPESYSRASFSPSGKSIVFSTGTFTDVNIGILQLSDESIQMVTDLPGREYDAVWAPNENYLAFTADGGKGDHFDIYLKDLKSAQSPSTALLVSPYSIRYLSWTPIRAMELEARKFREQSSETTPTPPPIPSETPTPLPATQETP